MAVGCPFSWLACHRARHNSSTSWPSTTYVFHLARQGNVGPTNQTHWQKGSESNQDYLPKGFTALTVDINIMSQWRCFTLPQPVYIEDGDQVVQLVVGSKGKSFPHRTLRGLTISQQTIHSIARGGTKFWREETTDPPHLIIYVFVTQLHFTHKAESKSIPEQGTRIILYELTFFITQLFPSG